MARQWSKPADVGQPDPGRLALRIFLVLLIIFVVAFYRVASQDPDLRSTIQAILGG